MRSDTDVFSSTNRNLDNIKIIARHHRQQRMKQKRDAAMNKVLAASRSRRHAGLRNTVRVGDSMLKQNIPHFRYAYKGTSSHDKDRHRNAKLPTPLNNPKFAVGRYVVHKKPRDINKVLKANTQSTFRDPNKNSTHRSMLDDWKRVKATHSANSRPRGEVPAPPKVIPRITEAESMADRYVIRPAVKKDRTLGGAKDMPGGVIPAVPKSQKDHSSALRSSRFIGRRAVDTEIMQTAIGVKQGSAYASGTTALRRFYNVRPEMTGGEMVGTEWRNESSDRRRIDIGGAGPNARRMTPKTPAYMLTNSKPTEIDTLRPARRRMERYDNLSDQMRMEQVGGRTLTNVVKMPFTGTLRKGGSEKNHRLHKGKEFLEVAQRPSYIPKATTQSIAASRKHFQSGNEVSPDEKEVRRLSSFINLRTSTGNRGTATTNSMKRTTKNLIILPNRNKHQYDTAHVQHAPPVLPKKVVTNDKRLNRGLHDQVSQIQNSNRVVHAI